MKDKLSKLSREIQTVFNEAIRTGDKELINEYDRLEDEYCIQRDIHRSNCYKNRKTKYENE